MAPDPLAPKLTPKLTPEQVFQQSNVSRETFEGLNLYAELLRKWQKAVNLVSNDSLEDLWRRHMLDSIQLAPYIEKEAKNLGRKPVIVDMGCGAGFPGLVLAILGLGEVHLIESDQKKCTFLQEVARAAKISVTIHEERIENIRNLSADIVTARALAPLEALLEYAGPLLKKGGQCFFLKGLHCEEELTQAQKKWTIWAERYPSLTSSSGVILHLKKVSRRQAGAAEKERKP